jgi:hypothetical protein
MRTWFQPPHREMVTEMRLQKTVRRCALGGVLGHWTRRQGYSPGRLTIHGFALPKPARSAVRERPRCAPIPLFICEDSDCICSNKCSGEHPSCQRCLTRGLVCAYAAERRMRGPNKPKPSHTPLPEGSQPATAVGQKMRKRASTMPSAPHRSSQIWGHQQNEQQEHGVATPTSPASESSVGSLVYPPASESGALPVTPPQCSLDGRHLSVPVVGFSAPQRVLVQDFQTTAHRRAQARVSESSASGHDDAGAASTRGVLTGVFGQDIFMM